jgi:ATP-binding cassette, subfamily B, bacterial
VPETPRSSSVLRWSLRLLQPYRRPLAVLSALSAAEVGLRVASPWALKAIVDHVFGAAPAPNWLRGSAAAAAAKVNGDPRIALLLSIIALGLIAHLTHQLILLLYARVSVGVSQRLTRDMREHLFGHLQRLALAHHAKTPAGDAAYRLNSDAAWLDQLVLRAAMPAIFSLITLVVMFALLLTISRPLAFVSLAVVPGLYLSLRIHGRRMQGEADRVKALESRVIERAQESFAAIRLVKTFGREPYERQRFEGVSRIATGARVGLSRREARFSFVVGALMAAGSSLVLAVGGALVLRGTISAGTLLLVLAYLGFVYGPLTVLSQSPTIVREAIASARRVRKVFSLAPEPFDVPGVGPLPSIAGAVRFDNVSFEYDEGRQVVRDVSFDIRPGELIAVVGPSGGGKTTLMNLITRLHEPTGGRILLDGIDTRKCTLASLREQVALVLQDAILVSDTVRENLRYGRLSATDAEIEAAARNANAHDFIVQLADGYDTHLGTAGCRLSGGQRQRLSIARAFLKDAPLLILDEPTSAVDTLSEAQFVQVLGRLRRKRTTFVIAHRLSTVRQADRILVMDAGKLVAAGTHGQLQYTCPLYARLAGDFTGADQPQIAALA